MFPSCFAKRPRLDVEKEEDLVKRFSPNFSYINLFSCISIFNYHFSFKFDIVEPFVIIVLHISFSLRCMSFHCIIIQIQLSLTICHTYKYFFLRQFLHISSRVAIFLSWISLMQTSVLSHINKIFAFGRKIVYVVSFYRIGRLTWKKLKPMDKIR